MTAVYYYTELIFPLYILWRRLKNYAEKIHNKTEKNEDNYKK